jgi:sugar phosphate permease
VLGLGVQAIGFIMSAAAAMDMLRFIPPPDYGSQGAQYAIVPSFTLQAAGMMLIPLTTGFAGLLITAAMIGFANGLSAGTMLTLGADFAPDDARGEFLGLWRLIGDIGSTGGPIVVGGVAALLALQTSAVVIAGTGLMAASIFAFRVPETLKRAAA